MKRTFRVSTSEHRAEAGPGSAATAPAGRALARCGARRVLLSAARAAALALVLALAGLWLAPGASAQSSDATLSNLVLKHVADPVAFDRTFSSTETFYRAAVGNSSRTLKVIPTMNHADATVRYLDEDEDEITDTDPSTKSLDMNLAVGRNVVYVQVTAENGTSRETYTVFVARAAGRPSGRCDAVWCANLTTGWRLAALGSEFGYHRTTMFGGALAPSTFSISGTTYTVQQLTAPADVQEFVFDLDRNLPADSYELEVGGEVVSFEGGDDRYEIFHYIPSLQSFGNVVLVKLRVRNTPARGAPGITRRPDRHELLAHTAGISDGNGLSRVSWKYQWLRVENDGDVEIGGAKSRFYKPRSADWDKRVKVRVTFTDDAGYEETRTSGGFFVPSRPPGLTGATVLPDGTAIDLTFHEDLDIDNLPSQWPRYPVWFRVDGTKIYALDLTVPDRSDPRRIRLSNFAFDWHSYLNTQTNVQSALYRAKIYQGQTVRVNYRDPSSVNDRKAIQDVHGNDTWSFYGRSVVNGSTLIAPAASTSTDCQDGDLLCADLRVGVKTRGSGELKIEQRGFNRNISMGSLSPKTFTVRQRERTVEQLRFNEQTQSSKTLEDSITLGFNDSLPWGFYTLVAGDRSVNFQGGYKSYIFRVTDIDWDRNDTIKVRLVGVIHTDVDDGAGGERGAEAPPSNDPLTASLDDRPGDHDGEEAFRVRIAFSEDIATSYRHFDDGFEVEGGDITSVRRVDGRRDLWEIELEPSGSAGVTLTLEGGRACSVTGAPCTSDGRTLSETLTFTVPGPAADPTVRPLNARFDHAPGEHDGESSFDIRVAFSQDITASARKFPQAFDVINGAVEKTRRVDGRSDLWRVVVEPDGVEPVTVTLRGNRTCGAGGVPCAKTADGKGRIPLSDTITVDIPGPAAISVADAKATEGTDETMEFTVSLDRAALKTITVDYATHDGTAAAGEDYTAASGTLTFEEGDTAKTVEVALLDDAIDEGKETFTLRLSNAVGARIADGDATGTIENDDPLQKAWLARFGRTVAGQAVDAVGERLGGGGASQVMLGGQALPLGHTPDTDAQAEAEAEARTQAMAKWLRGETEEAPSGRSLTGRELLLGSSFSLSAGGEAGAPRYGAWGRFATGRFDGEDDGVTLSGDVTTAFLGADVESGRWLGGVAVGLSEGEGPFRLTGDGETGRGSGTAESSLTAAWPYLRFAATERLSLWAMGGFGQGAMTIARDDARAVETDIAMTMGAVGAAGTVLAPPPEGGLALDVRSDALFVSMTSDAVRGDAANGGNLEAAEADVSRLRLTVEGARAFSLGEGETLTPALELGLRHDEGDAETGTGVEVGGRLSYTRPGVTVEGAVRALVAHEAEGYEEWGASGAVRIDPGASGRGLSFTLTPAWGNAGSGTGHLWSLDDARGLAPETEFEAGRRLDAELGYGLRAEPGVVTPFAGLGLEGGGGRTLSMGARWVLGSGARVELEGNRTEAANENRPAHALTLRTFLTW